MSSASSHSHEQETLLRAGIDHSLRHPVMFFLTSGSVWLAVSMLFGALASAKIHWPGLMSDCAWSTYGRVFPAHINTLIYGWGMQAAFAAILWLMARLSRKPCTMTGSILTAAHLWNLGVALGTVGILGGYGTGMPWMEFPRFAWPVLFVAYSVIVLGSFVQFRVRPEGADAPTQWFLLAAIIWFPWVFLTANVLLHWFPGHPVMAAGINAWFKSGLIFLFFIPVAIGSAFYLASKVTGLPLFSSPLAKLAFWSLAIAGPWAGMQKLAGAPLPTSLPFIGAAATAMMFLPLLTAGFNITRTVLSAKQTLIASPTLRFVQAGTVGLIVTGLSCLLLNSPGSTLQQTQFSLTAYGFDMLALYGSFSLILFGAAYFIVPRVTRREWVSRRLIKLHFLFSVYGTAIIAIITLLGGPLLGSTLEQWKPAWANIAPETFRYAVGITFAWLLILFSNLFFFVHLALMWLRLGRRSLHPTLLAAPSAH